MIKHLLQLAAAVAIATAIMSIVDMVSRGYDVPDNYMRVPEVTVPDHVTGENPRIVYRRSVFKNFRADWIVEVIPVTGGEEYVRYSVCTGSGTNEYMEGSAAGQTRTLLWYLGQSCLLAPGRYFLSTRWDVMNGPTIRNESNVFTVRPKENTDG